MVTLCSPFLEGDDPLQFRLVGRVDSVSNTSYQSPPTCLSGTLASEKKKGGRVRRGGGVFN